MTYFVAEGAPFRVDDDVLGVSPAAVPGADVVDVLQVAGVGPCAKDHSNPALGVLPGATGGDNYNRVLSEIFISLYLIKQPVVSLRMAQTSMLTSPLLSSASLSRSTTSLPSTPEHLNPFVQLVSRPTARPSCFTGKLETSSVSTLYTVKHNLNVKPSGSLLVSSLRFLSVTKSARHLAM